LPLIGGEGHDSNGGGILRIFFKFTVLFSILLLFNGFFPMAFQSDSSHIRFPLETDFRRSKGPNDGPEMVVDNTPVSGETGELFTFSVNFTDPDTVSMVKVNYTYGQNIFFNESMNNIAGDMWNLTVQLSSNHTSLEYIFFSCDGSNDNSTTQQFSVSIIDIIPPVANGGPDRDVPQGANFYINGTNSTDNIRIVNYTWNWHCSGCGQYHIAYGPEPLIWGDVLNFTVYLNVFDAAGNWANDSINITMIDIVPPIANAGSNLVIDQFQTAAFNGSSSGDNFRIVNYTWSFQYNGILINLFGVEITFRFDLAGVYSVELSVADAAGNSAPWSQDTLTVTVRDVESPTAIAGDDVAIDQHENVTFMAVNSHDNVNIISYLWNFSYGGEMRHLTGPMPNYQFHEAGIYDVTLNVSDERGNYAVDTMKVTVRDITPPTAHTRAEHWTEALGDEVVFYGGYSQDNVGIVNFTWSLHYNNTPVSLYGEEVSFRFWVPGEYVINLKVWDAEGNTDRKNCSVEVVDELLPLPDAGNDSTIEVGTYFKFNGSGTWDHSSIGSYIWIFTYGGHSQTLVGIDAAFWFNNTGEYSVILIVRDDFENMAQDTMTVTVIDTHPPVADPGVDDLIVFKNESVLLNASKSTDIGGIARYFWSFDYNGESIEHKGVEFEFKFDKLGDYSLMLTVTDNAGNEGISILNITVLNKGPSIGDDDVEDDDNDPNDDTVDNDDDDTIDDDIGDDDFPNTEKENSEKKVGPGIKLLISIISIVIILLIVLLFFKMKSKRNFTVNNGKNDPAINDDIEQKNEVNPDGGLIGGSEGPDSRPNNNKIDEITNIGVEKEYDGKRI